MEDIDNLPIPPIYVAPSSSGETKGVDTKFAQDVLLKALADGVTDPKELAKLAQLKKTADVYSVLDKLSLRKEFHAALDRAGLSLDFIVTRLKKICENEDDEISIKGLTTVLKTIGLDKAEETESSGRAWEDVVLERAMVAEETSPGVYEVIEPQMPESLRIRKEEDKVTGRGLYERPAEASPEVSP